MISLSRNSFQSRGILSALLVVALLSSSALAWQSGATATATKATATLTTVERKAAGRVKLETIREVTKTLSSNEFEGRGTAQPGADKAARYLADRFAKLRLKPGGENGTYLQSIKFKSAQVLPESSFMVGEAALKHGEDYILLPPYTSEQVNQTLAPDPMPEENAFVRSDHYAFVKRGVPALMLMGGPEGDLSTWISRAKKWLETDYHSPTDTVKPDWNWTGPQTLAQVGMIIGLRVANADAMPAWRTSSPFNKPRNQSKTQAGN